MGEDSVPTPSRGFFNKLSYNEIFKMNSSVWRDVRSQNGSWSGIVGLHEGNRVWRVSPDNNLDRIKDSALIHRPAMICRPAPTSSSSSLEPIRKPALALTKATVGKGKQKGKSTSLRYILLKIDCVV